MSKEQDLIDIVFDVGLMVRSHPSFRYKTEKDTAEWIASQLRQCGFDTQPMGSSWGVLKKEDPFNDADICPDCGKKTLVAQNSGRKCMNPKCHYWFCF